ncbi:MAG: hypothetical protein JWQ53_3212, partial [Klenkia sp.]|nr:hypothetical protein [Klenkia sp.]
PPGDPDPVRRSGPLPPVTPRTPEPEHVHPLATPPVPVPPSTNPQPALPPVPAGAVRRVARHGCRHRRPEPPTGLIEWLGQP